MTLFDRAEKWLENEPNDSPAYALVEEFVFRVFEHEEESLRLDARREAWYVEANEREARAANPDVVGVVERLTEEAVVRTLRRCAAETDGVFGEALAGGDR